MQVTQPPQQFSGQMGELCLMEHIAGSGDGNALPLDLGPGCMGVFRIAASSELWTSAHVINSPC